MKRFLSAAIIISLLLIVSCGVEFLSEEENVNDYIYPFLTFTPDEDGEGYVVTVVGGAELKEIYIPAEVEIGGVTVQVTSFGGFENPEDAKTLKVLELASSETTIKENALEKAENIKDIKVDSEKEGAVWGELSPVEKPGFEFDGWYIAGTDIRVNKGDRMIPGFTTLEPRWKEHTLVYHEEVKATCTKNGTKACYLCESCGRIFHDDKALEEISKEDIVIVASHSLIYTEAVAATCTTDGNSEYYKCTVCHMCFSDSSCENFLDEEDTVIRAKGHSLTEVKGKAATCTEDGFETYYRCSRPECGKYFSDSEGRNEITSPVITAATGHKWSDGWKTDENDHWHKCLNDGCTSINECEEHSFTIEKVTKDATYMEPGEKTLTCDVCGKTKTEEIPPTGGNHTWVKDTTVKPTCTERGYTVYVCTEDGCQATYVSDYVNAAGHKLEEVKRVEPTCTASGSEACWQCSECKKYFSDSTGKIEIKSPVVIPATGHNFEGSEYTVGETTHSRTCTNPGCSAVEEKAHVYKEKTEGRTPKKSQTCTEGAVYTKICDCGKESTEEFTVGSGSEHEKAEKHEYTASNCTVQGHKTYYTCSKECCKDKFYEDEKMTKAVTYDSLLLPLADHVYTKKNFEKTADAHTYICDACHKKKKTEDHTKTYDHDFFEHWWKCEICGYTSGKSSHTLTGEKGSRICSECGYKEKESQNEGGSFQVNAVYLEPTGTLSQERNGTVWTFTLTSTNPDAVPDAYVWYVDNNKVEGADNNVYVLTASERRSYRVMCVFKANGFYSSETSTITGGD